MAASTNGDQADILDISAHSTAQNFNAKCLELFAGLKDLTPRKDLEQRLNDEYGPGNPYYQDFCTYILQGLQEGWVAETKLGGDRYSRGKIAPRVPKTASSITTVYMDSEDVYSGQHHTHPYGEISCVVQVDETVELNLTLNPVLCLGCSIRVAGDDNVTSKDLTHRFGFKVSGIDSVEDNLPRDIYSSNECSIRLSENLWDRAVDLLSDEDKIYIDFTGELKRTALSDLLVRVQEKRQTQKHLKFKKINAHTVDVRKRFQKIAEWYIDSKA